MHICPCVYVCVCLCVCVFPYIYLSIYISICIYVYMYIYICTIHRFDAVDVANILQALVLVEALADWRPSLELQRRLVEQAGACTKGLQLQGLVTTLTGLAKLDWAPVPVLVQARLCLCALQIMKEGTSQDVSCLLWALGKMCWAPPPQLLDVLYTRMHQILDTFKRQVPHVFATGACVSVTRLRARRKSSCGDACVCVYVCILYIYIYRYTDVCMYVCMYR